MTMVFTSVFATVTPTGIATAEIVRHKINNTEITFLSIIMHIVYAYFSPLSFIPSIYNYAGLSTKLSTFFEFIVDNSGDK